MQILRIKLREGDSVGSILRVFEKTDADKVLFECPRNFAVLTDISFLKRLKTTADEYDKKLAFLVPQKCIRDIIKTQDLEVYSRLPETLSDAEVRDLSFFSENLVAQKNEEIVVEEVLPEVVEDEVLPSAPFSRHQIENLPSERSLRGHVFFIGLVVISVLGVLLHWISPSAEITLKPTISLLPFNQNIILRFDKEGLLPPAEEELPQITSIFVQTEVSGTKVFPSGGRTYDITNAHGQVTLYNEAEQPKTLVPSRLQAPGGAIFRFSREITIPPRTEDAPGQLVVDIEADTYDEEGKPIGERGNISAGTRLDFPALREESKELYYAKANKGPLVGGSTLTHFLVQAEDFEPAVESMRQAFRVQGEEFLRQEIEKRSEREQKRYVLLDDPELLQALILSVRLPEDQVGKESQTFELTGTVQVSGIVFDQSEVLKHLQNQLLRNQDQRKKIITIDENSIEYEVLSVDGYEDGWVKLAVAVSGVEVFDMQSDTQDSLRWQAEIKTDIAGRDIQEVNGMLLNRPEIEHVVNIRVTPFWTKKLPRIPTQITLKGGE